ncbi:hypothetical protein BSL78_03654 [Apostichopus japonicus]|uniref:Uncharacterized protein n=1 Tax=Stichopus japonicus TaxID=307972 RepID=A0A2G8LGR4_STIJA|nr:hypothetical protein BSL78_03654 [Apostichopus japonicus]
MYYRSFYTLLSTENATENSTSFTLGAETTVSSTIQSDEPTLVTNGDTFDNDNETFDVFQPIEIPLLYLMVAGVAFLTLTLMLLFIICLLHWSHRNADEPGIELNATRHSRIHHQVASTDIDDEHNSRPTSTAENQYAAEQKNRESTEAAMRRRTQEMKEMETFAPENIPTKTESNPTGAGLTVVMMPSLLKRNEQ